MKIQDKIKIKQLHYGHMVFTSIVSASLNKTMDAFTFEQKC